jgi:hypothetical protein
MRFLLLCCLANLFIVDSMVGEEVAPEQNRGGEFQKLHSQAGQLHREIQTNLQQNGNGFEIKRARQDLEFVLDRLDKLRDAARRAKHDDARRPRPKPRMEPTPRPAVKGGPREVVTKKKDRNAGSKTRPNEPSNDDKAKRRRSNAADKMPVGRRRPDGKSEPQRVQRENVEQKKSKDATRAKDASARKMAAEQKRNRRKSEAELETKKSETKKPETKKPETKKPETKKPETKKPETKKSEAKKSEAKKSEAKKSETKKSETKKSETKKPETSTFDDPNPSVPIKPTAPNATAPIVPSTIRPVFPGPTTIEPILKPTVGSTSTGMAWRPTNGRVLTIHARQPHYRPQPVRSPYYQTVRQQQANYINAAIHHLHAAGLSHHAVAISPQRTIEAQPAGSGGH